MCQCDCSFSNEIPSDAFVSENIVVARKKHKCCECREEIQIGEKYERATGKSDGMFSFSTCLICAKIRKDLCCSWEYEMLKEQLLECLGFDYTTREKGE